MTTFNFIICIWNMVKQTRNIMSENKKWMIILMSWYKSSWQEKETPFLARIPLCWFLLQLPVQIYPSS